MDCSPLSFSVHGIFQARTLEWVAISFFRGSSQPRDRTHVSCISCTSRQILYHCAFLVCLLINLILLALNLHSSVFPIWWVSAAAAAAAKSLQLCLTLCDPIDGSPLGSSVPGILQARILEWVAISFSNAWKWKVKVNSLSHVRLLATPWTAAYQAPPNMGFSRQESWSGLPLPSLIASVHGTNRNNAMNSLAL